MSQEDSVAIIGTRKMEEVPEESLQLFKDASLWIGSRFKVKTGAAKGSDQLGADYALKKDATIELYLPWKDYEQEWVREKIKDTPSLIKVHVYNQEACKEWKQSVFEFHPNPKALTRGGVALHARNYPIVNNTKFVLALTHPTKAGGTEQGIRIATAKGIQVYDLSSKLDREELKKLIGI